jgi:hypothetical protein
VSINSTGQQQSNAPYAGGGNGHGQAAYGQEQSGVGGTGLSAKGVSACS